MPFVNVAELGLLLAAVVLPLILTVGGGGHSVLGHRCRRSVWAGVVGVVLDASFAAAEQRRIWSGAKAKQDLVNLPGGAGTYLNARGEARVTTG